MSEEERQNLIIHPNPNWRRAELEDSGEYASIVPGPRNENENHGRILRRIPHRGNSNTSQAVENPLQTSENWALAQSCGPILLAVVLERLSFYGLSVNLVLLLYNSPFNWASYNVASAVLLFYGFSFIVSLIGGWLADSLLGRFKTLVITYLFYICGFMLMPFIAASSEISHGNLTFPKICAKHEKWHEHSTADNPFEERCSWIIFIALTLVAIGVGAYKANICPFGSDQLEGFSAKVQFSFFNWYYWCINLGAIISLSAMAYVEQQKSFQLGYAACTVTLICSFIIFVAGRCKYVVKPANGSVLTEIYNIFRSAWHNKLRRKQDKRLSKRITEVAGDERPIRFLDYATVQHGGIFSVSDVENVKKLKIILLVFAVSIFYWLVYFQSQSTFMIQGLHMKMTSDPGHKFNVSNSTTHGDAKSYGHPAVIVAAWVMLSDTVTVFGLLPLFDRVIYPFLDKRGFYPSCAKRILLGYCLAIASLIMAAVVEYFRLNSLWRYKDEPCMQWVVDQDIDGTTYYAAEMSILWQIPQYVLMGLSEVFASVAFLQFAVSVAPSSMKGLVTGFYYLFMGLGSFAGTALISMLADSRIWFNSANSGNINCRFPCNRKADYATHSCHLDYFFYLVAGMAGLGLILFACLSHKCGLDSREIMNNHHGLRGRQIQQNKTRSMS